jgi:gliding motility-associated lipoprotein GldH
MMKYLTIVISFSALLMMASCNQSALYHQHVTLDEQGWPKNEAVHFNVTVPDTLTPYDYYLTIRHTNNYAYSNIYFFLETKFPNGNVTRDTIECILANDEGKWYGKGWGNIKEDNILLNKNMLFPVSGTYDFYFIQAMRTDTLKDFVSLGINIVKS